MARGARRRPTPPPNSVIASAVRLGATPGVSHPNRPATSTEQWQTDGWYYLDTCGELAFAAGWYSNALSRVRLYVQKATPDGAVEVTTGAPAEALAALGDDGRRSQVMAAVGLHIFVPGECFLVGYTEDDPAETEVWDVYSTDEVRQQGTSTTWIIDRGDGEKRLIDTADEADLPAIVIRIWHSHPRRWVEATSPVRAVLPVLRELEGLTKHIGATIDSRLAGAGILAVPTEMTFSSPLPANTDGDDTVTGDPDPSQADQDQFIQDLGEAMITPIKDRGNAAAVVPIVVRAPGALLGAIRHITMDSPLDEHAIELRSECIRRLALGLDMPPEVLLGTGDVNHWGAWQIEEAALKTHIEPACELITSALTQRYLLPVLDGQGFDTTGISVEADTSDLRLRPNRTEEAFQLYDRWGINLDALLRETGFDVADKPLPAELQQIILTTLARGGTTPDMVAAALAALGVPLPPEPSTVEAESPPPALGPAPEEPPPPETDIENRREPPDQAAALLAAAEPLVARAVERARNRAIGRGKRPRPVREAAALEALGAGCFDADLITRTADRLCLDARGFGNALIQASMMVLVTGVPAISEDDLARVLSLIPAKRPTLLDVARGVSP